MKTIKTITLDYQISERLKEIPNQSGLINSLLERHFSIINEDITPEQLLERKRALQKQLINVKNRMKLSAGLIEKSKIKEIKIQNSEIQKEKERTERFKLKAELRAKYAKETPNKEQSYEGFETFLKKRGFI